MTHIDRAIKESLEEAKKRLEKHMQGNDMDSRMGIPMPGPGPDPGTRDPWQGRSEHMKCRSCMSYAPKTDNLGRCRHRAPTMQGFPVVYPDADWCRQHKIDEGYIEYQKAREKEENKNFETLVKGDIDR